MNKSFTIIESLVVMFIIVLLSLIILPNYYSTKQQLAFQRSAFKLAQDIRVVQEMAMSTQEYSACLGTAGYKYGYGIYLKKMSQQSMNCLLIVMVMKTIILEKMKQ